MFKLENKRGEENALLMRDYETTQCYQDVEYRV